MIQELDQVILNDDLPENGLKVGNIGTVVLVHGKGKGFEVEFVALDGKSLAVVSVLPHQLRVIGKREIARSRSVELTLAA
jgi:hypothetical protein